MKLKTGFIYLLAVATFLTAACSDNDEEKNATIEVRLTDAPGDYDEVNVDIRAVEVHMDDEDSETGWRTLDINPGVYNLLEYTNGLDTLLGVIEVPATRVSQIRLILGDDNTVKIDDHVYDLTTPSAQQSGLKLNVQTDLKGGITYRFLLDFDAARSIVHTGSDKYMLKPVIRLIPEAIRGAIKGSVSIPAAAPAVYAIMNDDTVGTSFANGEGLFWIKGLPAGTYTVAFSPASGYMIETKNNVNVTVDEVTNLGVVNVISVVE